MRLADLVVCADEVASTTSRNGKIEVLAALLRRAEPRQAAVAAQLLAGDPRQGRAGVGWGSCSGDSGSLTWSGARRCGLGVVTDDPDEAEQVFAAAVDAGHEGIMVKAAESPYAAGRRGKAWRKVKPVHRFDLVVLAVEPGSGRRRGWLSNIHLGALDPDGGFVMVGKTFKGMTDAMLEWQTQRFGELAVDRRLHMVELRPEQVVEVAVDGVQRSSRYPGGVALRFARVVRYRSDKAAHEADTIEAVRCLTSRQHGSIGSKP